MTDTLWGVVVGLVGGSLVPLVTLFINLRANNQKWKNENRLAHLREKRARLEAVSFDFIDRTDKGEVDKVLAQIYFVSPPEVIDALDEFRESKKLPKKWTLDDKQQAIVKWARLMAECIREVDKEIDDMLKE